MRHLADRFVVVLDANVLFPFRKRDVLLHFYHAGLFRARWTAQILDEWTEKLLEQKPSLEASIRSQQQAMEEHFPEALVSGYEALIDGLALPDPNDRHVLAAAIQCGAQHIVTENLRDFPETRLAGFDVEAIGCDEFLSRTFDLYVSEALVVLKQVRALYRNPAFTPSEFVLDLTASGLPKLAARLREHREFL
ncbi:MAG: PIN domain-containing protein [Gammaproteobacteria bacterium]|nr:PIN domain-containing protein [Gammaproteobacteria bacterium]